MSENKPAEPNESPDTSTSDMITFIAHQIRSPLNTVRLAQQALLESNSENLTVEQRRLIEQSYVRIQNVLELTMLLLRTESQATETTPSSKRPGSLEQLLNIVVEKYSIQTEAKRLNVKTDFANNPKLVEFDYILIEEAVSSLVDNAIKYTPVEGDITISTSYTDTLAIVKVSDSGIGLGSATEDKIFSKFYRSQTAIAADHNGLGLGLYLAKLAVERHGGTINSGPNNPKGAVFTIAIPLKV